MPKMKCNLHVSEILLYYSIYPSELEIKDTTESSTSASYSDILLNMDAGRTNNNSIV
jgi:hypothetical protein